MGMTLETLKMAFPRSWKALDQHKRLLAKYIDDRDQRATVEASLNLLVIAVADEVGGITKGIGFLRDVFGKGRG